MSTYMRISIYSKKLLHSYFVNDITNRSYILKVIEMDTENSPDLHDLLVKDDWLRWIREQLVQHLRLVRLIHQHHDLIVAPTAVL